MRQFLRLLARETEGATAVEYGLILALIFLAMVGAVQAFGVTAISMWTTIAENVTGAGKD
ncbi:MAG: Flp family type IVb pilin [Alphaproteobacteria bacterium]|jgi:pilus assembly protein Flp/PilA|nr:Flp family type IVb pilin [Alphaproteobacteria bacterium]MBU1756139.1 Flp family type IVb pilin [Alphaproteobacteria bacterium]MBU2340473.1 Flp family type IVb pilin [Alphaproteobacteria bacterium]